MTEADRQQVRNDAIEEMCTWLESCLAQVDPKSETYQSCTAMVRGLRNKKTAVATEALQGQHYPLTKPRP